MSNWYLQDKFVCADKKEKCNLGPSTTLLKFAVDNMDISKIHDAKEQKAMITKRICGDKSGEPVMCCDKNDPSLQTVTSSKPGQSDYYSMPYKVQQIK